MAGRLYIPDEVKESISKHIEDGIEKCRQGYLSAAEDEDALTGDLGACLRTSNQIVNVSQGEIRGDWKWAMTYYKFRGRGANAMESIIGADGVFEITLDSGYRTETKSLLFQAKKEWTSDAKLRNQAILLSTWREAAIVINYTPQVFEAFNLDGIIRSHGKKSNNQHSDLLSHVLGGDFLDCKVGDTELKYEAERGILRWRDMSGLIVSTKFKIKHRVGIKISKPSSKSKPGGSIEIGHDEILNHRMAVSNENILSLKSEPSAGEVKAAHKQMALAYHPDKIGSVDDLLLPIITRRMQEVNHAKDEMLERIRNQR